MHDTVMYSLVIYAVGCVIPTQLEREQTPTNYPPVWVTSMVKPPFGALAPQAKNDSLELTLFASDPNLGDTLVAQAFLYNSSDNSYEVINSPATLTPPSTSTGNATQDAVRSGQFAQFEYCNNRISGTYLLYAFVADRPFVGNTPTVKGGLSDSNHWELPCM